MIGDTGPKYLNSPETPLFHKGHHLFNLHRARSEIRKEQQARNYAVLKEIEEKERMVKQLSAHEPVKAAQLSAEILRRRKQL